jgi:hypothetical protein
LTNLAITVLGINIIQWIRVHWTVLLTFLARLLALLSPALLHLHGRLAAVGIIFGGVIRAVKATLQHKYAANSVSQT